MNVIVATIRSIERIQPSKSRTSVANISCSSIQQQCNTVLFPSGSKPTLSFHVLLHNNDIIVCVCVVIDRKDTLKHVAQAVDRSLLGLVKLFELSTQVKEPEEEGWQVDALESRFWYEAHAQVELTVGAEGKRACAPVIGVELVVQEEFLELF